MSDEIANPLIDIDPDINHYDNLNNFSITSAESKYFDSQEFNSNFKQNSNDLSIVHVNARSMNQNGDDLVVFLGNLSVKFDVICISETWFRDENLTNNFFPNHVGFHSWRLDGRTGGGASIYVAKYLKAQLIESISNSSLNTEYVFIKIFHNNRVIVAGSCYRAPSASSNLECFNRLMSDKLSNLDLTKVHCVLCGDFNADLFKYSEDSNIAMFYDNIHSHSLIPVITKPTRITNSSFSLIDNIFTTSPYNIFPGILKVDISDHFPIFLIFKDFFNSINKNESRKISFRLASESRLLNLRAAVASTNFDEILNEVDCEVALSKLHELILNLYNKHCPIKHKNLSYKDITKPWISSEIKQNMKRRENYFNLFRRGLISVTEYNSFRNFVTKQIRDAKNKYLTDLFEKFKKDTKNTWKEINNLIKGGNRFKDVGVECLDDEGCKVRGNERIAEIFNSHFSTIGQRISNTISCNERDHLQFLSHISMPNSFFLNPISAINVENAIGNLKNKSSNIETYPNKILKFIKVEISPILASIFNRSISNGVFPDFLKIAKVIPLFKSGDKEIVGNYRPISILPTFSKILERTIYNQLLSYFDRYELFSDSQFGFRRKKSTAQAILDNVQFIYDNLDRGDLVASFFLDFQKAFDCVSHNILLSKLSTYGIRGITLEWFRSFLTNRKQFTSINNVDSSTHSINCGVPQGSILSPLLFLIYINDFPKCSSYFKFVLFADDSTLSCKIPRSDPIRTALEINSELNKIHSWLNSNKIKCKQEYISGIFLQNKL